MPDSAIILNYPVGQYPESGIEQSVGIDCCEEYRALASLTSTAREFNDEFMAIGKKAIISDSISFSIKKCGGCTLPNLGTELEFPQDNLAVGFIYDLRQYLSAYDGGIYIISQVEQFLGQTIESEYARIKLWEFTDVKARRTFKMRSNFDQLSKVNNQFIDFTGSNAYSDLRLGGKFGTWNAQTENRVLVDYAYDSESTTTTNKNKYLLEVDPITYLFSKRLIKLHLLAGSRHEFTDHNYNHRKYTNFATTYITETLNQEEPSIETLITAEFNEYTQNEFSRYNKN